MAINFVVEDGTGLPTATSYVSVSEADDIVATNLHDSVWSSLTVEQKQNTLIWASRLLDERVDWEGNKAVQAGSLRWPRTGVQDRDGFMVPSNTVPVPVATAATELARHLAAEDPTVPAEEEGIEELGVDVVKIKFDTNHVRTTFPSRISHILSGYGIVSGSTSFGKIVRI